MFVTSPKLKVDVTTKSSNYHKCSTYEPRVNFDSNKIVVWDIAQWECISLFDIMQFTQWINCWQKQHLMAIEVSCSSSRRFFLVRLWRFSFSVKDIRLTNWIKIKKDWKWIVPFLELNFLNFDCQLQFPGINITRKQLFKNSETVQCVTCIFHWIFVQLVLFLTQSSLSANKTEGGEEKENVLQS